MKHIIMSLLSSTILINAFAQKKPEYNPLAQAVIAIQKYAGPGDIGPFKAGPNQATYYLNHGLDSISPITLEDINKLNHLEYDIRLTFDFIYKNMLLKRAIILDPVSKERQKKLLDLYLNDPRFKKQNTQQ